MAYRCKGEKRAMARKEEVDTSSIHTHLEITVTHTRKAYKMNANKRVETDKSPCPVLCGESATETRRLTRTAIAASQPQRSFVAMYIYIYKCTKYMHTQLYHAYVEKNK